MTLNTSTLPTFRKKVDDLEGEELVHAIEDRIRELIRLGAVYPKWVVGPVGFARRFGMQIGDWVQALGGLITVLENPDCISGFYFPTQEPSDEYWVSQDTTPFEEEDTVEAVLPPERLSTLKDPDEGPGGPKPRASVGYDCQWGEEFEL